MITSLRQRRLQHRFGIYALTLLQTFFMVGGAEAVQERQRGVLQAQAESARMARTFGVPLERWNAQEPGWLQRSGDAVAEEVHEVIDHGRREVKAWVEQIREPATVDLDMTPGVGQPTSGQLSEKAASSPRRYIPRRSALAAGEGERTAAPRLAKGLDVAKWQLGPSAEASALPLHVVQRRAQTVDAESLPTSLKVTSAIASASPRSTGLKANKAIAPEIVALAASLDNSPAKMFRYVHDQVDYDPKWGVDSTPLGTLWEGRGTSWDQAWLLQELLTAAGVDARLEWGRVEIPTELLTNLTGIDDPIRAGDFLATAGLDVLLVIQGSQVTAARFPHVWVKAHLDYIPNRGAASGTPDTWIRMDPSLTTFERTDGLRLDQDVPFVLGDHLQSGTELSPRQDYETALLAHVADQGLPVGTLDDAKSLHRQVAEEFPFVPGTLRAKIVSAAGESETVPAAFEQDVELQIREEGGGALLTWTTTASAIYGQRLEVVWQGATSSDQAALDLYGGIFATPPYEVELRPALRLDGVEVASGTAIGSAEDAEILLTLTPPGGTGAGDGVVSVAGWDLFAGEHGVVSLDYGRAPPELADRFAQEALNAAGDDFEMEGWQLAQAASTYLNALGGDLSHLVDLSWHRLLTFNTAVFAVQRGAVSTSPDGTPQTFSPGPLALDVGAMPLAVMPVDGVQTSTVPTLELLGSQGSYREGEALASVFGGEHLSAVTFLTRAVREGQALTQVDLSNLDAALGAAEISSDAKGAIRYAVEQLGMEAWISETQIESNTFQTTGYILIDPATGTGGYFVTFERLFRPLDGAITFHNPIDLDVITAPTDVIASIDAEGIESWTLSTRPVGEGATTVIATGTGPVDNTVLGQFDPTLLLNGMHDLVLTGRDGAGQPVSGKVTVSVEGNMKLGNFTLSFVDLAIPLSGLDIEIVRTYDSRQRAVEGDFGYGWSLDIRQGTYRNNRLPGDGWQIVASGGPLGLPCQQTLEDKSHLTTVRLSDSEVYRFRPRLTNVGVVIGGCFASVEYEQIEDGPLPGAQLEVVGSNEVIFRNSSGNLVHRDTLEIFEPQDVRLTTRDGRTFELDLNVGVTRLEDANGNAVDISEAGILHSSGVGVDFERDAEGRITRIVDPAGQANVYAYDALGDLVTFEDRLEDTSTFTYLDGHYLQDIENALGVRAMRTEYDDDGRILRMIDAAGRAIAVEHDVQGRREVVTNRLGFAKVFEYDERGNVIVETDESGAQVRRVYDQRDRLLSYTDPLGATTQFRFDTFGDLVESEDPLGRIHRFTYNASGFPASFTDPMGRTTTLGWDAKNNLVSLEDALGNLSTVTYTAAGDVAGVVDAEGNAYGFEYDGNGWPERIVDPLGNVTTLAYNGLGQLLTQQVERTTADGSVEVLNASMEYDALGRVTRRTEPGGAVYTLNYDAAGRLTGQTDPLGRAITRSYDALGRWTGTTHADGSQDSYAYDAEGGLTVRTDAQGRATTLTRGPTGRLDQLIHPDGASVTYGYDLGGRLTSLTDPLGRITRFNHNAAGEVIETIDPAGRTNQLFYDLAGNVVRQIDADGLESRVEFDAMDRPTKVIFPDGSEELTTYNATGQPLTITDEDGQSTTFAFDGLNRLIEVTDSLGHQTRYGYDELGNLIRQVDANGRETRFEVDAAGRRTARILPDGLRETMSYLADGSLATHTDFGGASRTFEYDDMGRLTRRLEPDGREVSWTYTATGQRSTVTDPRGTTSYQYDARDRLTGVSHPGGEALGYVYDSAGRLTEMSVLVSNAVVASTTLAYGIDDQPSSITDPDGGVHQLAYDNKGNLLSVLYPNGLTTEASYDLRDRLVGLATRDAQGVLVENFQDVLSPTGRRLQSSTLDGTTRQFTYDPLGRLLEEQVTDGAGDLQFRESFTYDAVGNRTRWEQADGSGLVEATDFTYDVRDRLLTAGSNAFTWDADGNLSSITGAEPMQLEWDSENRLTRVVNGDGSELRNGYDADGNRVLQTVLEPDGSATTRRLVVDSLASLSHVVAELSDQGDVETVYTRLEDQLLSSHRPAAGSTQAYHPDTLGSVRLLTDDGGQTTQEYSYSSYGVERQVETTDTNPYRFAGEPSLPQFGLSYLRARWLMPSTGTFVSMDAFEGNLQVPQSLNKYGYAHGDPINLVDPTGNAVGGVTGFLVSFAVRGIMGAAIGAVLGGAFGGLDAFFGGRDVAQGIKDGATFGAIFGALGSLKFLQPILMALGLGFGAVGTFQAIMDEDWDLAVFRGVTLLAGAFMSYRAYQMRNVRMMDPAELRWSQNSAGANGRADALKLSLGSKGWKGPAIDAVQTPDGITTVDHTRAAVALELGIKQIPVRVHQPQSLLPWSMLSRPWNRFGNTARTWGEAVILRALGQKKPKIGPTGREKPPKLRYKKKPK